MLNFFFFSAWQNFIFYIFGQIKTHIKSLKKLYKLQKDRLDTSGTAWKIKFPYFDVMDAVLGNRAVLSPGPIIESDVLGLENLGK